MTNSIEVNSIVMCPVTDEEGEVEFRVGELMSINSRYATVKVDGKTIKVGKTKIELMTAPKPKKVVKDTPWEMPKNCPHCDIDLSNGVGEHLQEVNDQVIRHDEFQFECLSCGIEFGPAIGPKREYNCRASSGRKSIDNGDGLALQLRGQTLEFAYELGAKHLGETVTALKAKYKHLNPGQQRMCLGNRLRKK